MEILHWLSEFIKQNGLVGTLLLLFVADKLKLIDKATKWFRRDKEDHQHKRTEDAEEHSHRRIDTEFDEFKKSVEDKFEDQGMRIRDQKNTLDFHLEKEAKEDIRMEGLTNRVSALEDKVTDQLVHIFNQHTTIFSKIDDINNKIDVKFDNLDQDIKQILLLMRK